MERNIGQLAALGKGVVKSRSLLGHFHRFHSSSGSKKAHKRRDTFSTPGCLWHIRRDFTTKESMYNKKKNKI
jgi:hypothetical protein